MRAGNFSDTLSFTGRRACVVWWSGTWTMKCFHTYTFSSMVEVACGVEYNEVIHLSYEDSIRIQQDRDCLEHS